MQYTYSFKRVLSLLIAFRVSPRRRKMYSDHGRLSVCVSVSVCLCVSVSVPRRMPTLVHFCNFGKW